MGTPTPAPGVTPSAPGVPSSSGSSGANAFGGVIGAFQQPGTQQGGLNAFVGASQTKPGTSVSSNYGPLSGPNLDYQHGTFNSASQPYRAPIFQVTKPVADVANEYYSWSDQQKQDFRSKLALIDKSALTAPDDTIAQAWANYAQQSANYLSAGQTITPMDILAKDLAMKSNAGPTTKTQTTSDTTLTSRADASAIFKSAAQSLLGRDPTPDEEANFANLLNQQEQANPTQATITTTTDAEGNATNQTRTTQGGFTSTAAADLAKQVAQQSPDYGANAANNYMKVLLGLVGVK